MRAITVTPGRLNSARLEDLPEPLPSEGPVLIEALAIGVCGTDREIVSGAYGWSPPGRDRLILGHESLARVLEAPEGGALNAGDLVAGIVRQPDPVPCPSCAVGEWDMCRNGQYTEHGIKALDGFGAERFRLHPQHTVKLDGSLGHLGVLLEPTSIVAKAWEQIERIGARAYWQPKRVLITGAGPIGLLAALLAVQRGLEVHVFDRATEGPKPGLVAGLGGQYHTGAIRDACPNADIVVECTGVAELVLDGIHCAAPDGIVCLTGVAAGGRPLTIDVAALNREMVLENQVVFGTVNANRRHYEAAAEALAKADRAWLAQLVTRRVPIDRWAEALQKQANDVKTVIEFKSI